MKKRRIHAARMAVSGAIAAGLVIATAVLATPAAYAEDPTTGSETAKVITYAIDDPDLVRNPGKVSDELRQAGNLDGLGVQPSTDGKPSRIANRPFAAGPPATYVVDSSRFPGGAKPDDPYQYTDENECYANLDQASTDAGWIKNRYSYCQVHLIAAVSVLCVLFEGCDVTGVYLSLNTLVGFGKIGAYDETTGDRWTDFRLTVQVLTATGPFLNKKTRLTTSLECDGHYDTGGPDADPAACSGGKHGRTKKPIITWLTEPTAGLDLVSTGVTPSAAAGEQLATGNFHVHYDFDLPFPYIFDIGADGPDGGVRFDSAWYLTTNTSEQLGSVFSGATPGFSYRLGDSAVTGVAQHLLRALAVPASTIPLQPGKTLAGIDATDPIHRLAPGKDQYTSDRYDENRRVVRNFCRTTEMPPQPTTGGPFDCDEYPFASSYEGAGRSGPGYDGPSYDRFYSVEWVNSDQNQEAGRRLGRWYANDRIIDRDAFFVPILF